MARRLAEATSKGWVAESDRLRFFALAHYVARRNRAGAIHSPGAAFTSALKRRLWYGSAEDERAAKAALGKLPGMWPAACTLMPYRALQRPLRSSTESRPTWNSRDADRPKSRKPGP